MYASNAWWGFSNANDNEEYLVSFLFEAVSAALPAQWDVECRYESARVLTNVTYTTSEVCRLAMVSM